MPTGEPPSRADSAASGNTQVRVPGLSPRCSGFCTMRHMDPELAQLCQTIDPADLGKRIRDARLAAGMTQAQLAGDDVSVAYISRIEDGQRRPDLDLIRRFADRLATTAEELVLGIDPETYQELRSALDFAELSVASGDPDEGLTGANRVLTAINGSYVPTLRRAALRVLAAAQESLGDMDGAVATLSELAADPTPDREWLRALIALSRCLRENGDFERAIAAGEDAEPMIKTLGIEGLTEAIQLVITVAGAYAFRGDSGHAMRLYKRSIATAERFGLPLAKASAYWNASVIECDRGQPGIALDLAQLAMREFEEGEDLRNVGRLRSFIADLQLRLDPPDAVGALTTLELADRELAWSSAGAADRARQHRLRGEAHYFLGDHQTAMDELRLAASLAPSGASTLAASVPVVMGRITAAEGLIDEARAHYEDAVRTLSAIGSDRGVAELWFELGGLLLEVGEPEGARDAFRRAAISTGLGTSLPRFL